MKMDFWWNLVIPIVLCILQTPLSNGSEFDLVIKTNMEEIANSVYSLRLDMEELDDQKTNDINLLERKLSNLTETVATLESRFISNKNENNQRVDELRTNLEAGTVNQIKNIQTDFDEKLQQLETKLEKEFNKKLKDALLIEQTTQKEEYNKLKEATEKLKLKVAEFENQNGILLKEVNTRLQTLEEKEQKNLLNGSQSNTEVRNEDNSDTKTYRISGSQERNLEVPLESLQNVVSDKIDKLQLEVDDLKNQSHAFRNESDMKFQQLITDQIDQQLNISQLIASLKFEISTTDSKTEKLNATLDNRVDMKLDQLETRVNEAMQNHSSSTRSWFQVLQANFTNTNFGGRLVSINESRNPTDSQYGGCGGILVGDKGYISYASEGVVTQSFRCIWTVRANKSSKISLSLQRDDLGSGNLLLIAPLTATFTKGSFAPLPFESATVYLNSSSGKGFIFEGPVVFVTFIATSGSPSFQLYFEGKGGENENVVTYTHYHYRENIGLVDYPHDKGMKTYSANEIATFVINPPLSENKSLKIQSQYLDTEVISSEGECYDSLSYWLGHKLDLNYYRFGPGKSDYRFCGRNEKFRYDIPNLGFNGAIVVFKSDDSFQFSGFKFNWKEVTYSDKASLKTFGSIELERLSQSIAGIKTGIVSSELENKWTVFQRRGIIETSPVRENFRRNWQEYANGFGNSKSDFWIGLETLHKRTNGCPHELLLDLTNVNGSRYEMYYSKFLVADSRNKYLLTLEGFQREKSSRSLDEAFAFYNSGQPFSTYDVDNDKWNSNCAADRYQGNGGGWWYKHCSHVFLNNPYPPEYIEGKLSPEKGISWTLSNKNEFKRVEMKMRPNC